MHSLRQTAEKEEEEDTEEPSVKREGRWLFALPSHNARDLPQQSLASLPSAEPLSIHSTWRGVYKSTDRSYYAALRISSLDIITNGGQGVLRLSNYAGVLENEARFDFVVEDDASMTLPKGDAAIRLTFDEEAKVPEAIKADLGRLSLTGVEPVRGYLRSPRMLCRRSSASPPPMRIQLPNSLSSSLPSPGIRRMPTSPIMAPVSWAAIVRGTTEEKEEEAVVEEQPANTPVKSMPISITPSRPSTTTSHDLNVFSDDDFPAPASPPAYRPSSRRRVASCGPTVASTVTLPRPRPPITGSRWAQVKLTAQEGRVDFRYYAVYADEEAWHNASAYAAKTLASASFEVL